MMKNTASQCISTCGDSRKVLVILMLAPNAPKEEALVTSIIYGTSSTLEWMSVLDDTDSCVIFVSIVVQMAVNKLKVLLENYWSSYRLS